MLIGVSFNIRDKRVDRKLMAENIICADVYYSPIGSWILVLFLFGIAIGAFLIPIFQYFYHLAVLYIIVSYLINARLSNSFVLQYDQVIVINPNVPFRQFNAIPKSSIRHIAIKEREFNWQGLFLAIGKNYLEVDTKEGVYKFPCAGLEQDSYDENWTEKTIDELYYVLQQAGYSVSYEIKD